jgi:hypothetical protein
VLDRTDFAPQACGVGPPQRLATIGAPTRKEAYTVALALLSLVTRRACFGEPRLVLADAMAGSILLTVSRLPLVSPGNAVKDLPRRPSWRPFARITHDKRLPVENRSRAALSECMVGNSELFRREPLHGGMSPENPHYRQLAFSPNPTGRKSPFSGVGRAGTKVHFRDCLVPAGV